MHRAVRPSDGQSSVINNMPLTEAHVEEAALEWFGELWCTVENGAKLAPGEAATEREATSCDYEGSVLSPLPAGRFCPGFTNKFTDSGSSDCRMRRSGSR